jgi:glyoxylase-like metal-dependent hydrolase (beta-lactamase superfamily II)
MEVLPDVFCFPDSCNVYAVIGPEGALIVDAGTGRWLDAARALPTPVVALACTHYFRDHSAGATKAAHQGIPVYVPEGERELFADPELHFLRRETYVIYTNTWDQFAPIEAVPITGLLQDHVPLRLAGLDVDVVPLPGATITQVGLQLTLPKDGRAVIFCGEAIHSPGRVARIAPFQYGYEDLPGALNAISSARELRRRAPDALLPSLGNPVTTDPDGALRELEEHLRGFAQSRISVAGEWRLLDEEPLRRITDHVWQTPSALAIATFVISPSGKVLVIDLGYDQAAADSGASSSAPHRRRGSLRPVIELSERFGTTGVDVALVSHYHDDHVASIPLLQRAFGTECWCPSWFADILERPSDYAFPCTWPIPIRVDRRIPPDKTVTWEGINFSFAPMSGHTRFAAAIGFEVDGVRFAHTGDQYHFVNGWAAGFPVPTGYVPDWATDQADPGWVYRNGAFLESFAASARWLREWHPDVVLCGHQPAMWTDEQFFARIDEHATEYERLHREAMSLGEDDAHFGLDSWGGWIVPYRTHLTAPGTVTVTANVRNPMPHRATLDVHLVGPAGWRGSSATMQAAARAEVACTLTIDIPERCRRRPIAVELEADQRPFGQVAEALVTVGGTAF